VTKPHVYHLEIYQDSFLNDPVWSIKASSAFSGMSVGDRFEHRASSALAWDQLPTVEQEFRVKDIEHLYWELDSEIGHKLMVKLGIVEQVQEF
jgi:hypothetical protein